MIPLTGADVELGRLVWKMLETFPRWFVKAARVSKIEVTGREEVREMFASYTHGERVLYLSDKIRPGFLRRALAHELAHGCDDYRDNPHYFSSSFEWERIHQKQSFFDHPKYKAEALEYFADVFAKYLMVGSTRLAMTAPDEVTFFDRWVVPTLTKEFS